LPLLFYHARASTELYSLSLHDALPISAEQTQRARSPRPRFPLEVRPLNRRTPHPLTWVNTDGEEGRGCPAHLDVASLTAGNTPRDRKSTRLNSSHVKISYAVFCLKKKR